MSDVSISQGTFEQASILALAIPELPNVLTPENYAITLENTPHTILVAKDNDQFIGFKIAYALNESTLFIWLTGILPEYRRKGVAKLLLGGVEAWARAHSFNTIETRMSNHFPQMMEMLMANGFLVASVEQTEALNHGLVTLQKPL